MTTFVVVPCYNEESRWNRRYWSELLELPGFHWIFVDDGSRDSTGKLIAEICTHDNAELVTKKVNSGKAEAVRSGLLSAVDRAGPEDLVGFMDADGAFDLPDIRRLTSLIQPGTKLHENFDALWSARVALAGRSIRRSSLRHYLGRVAATVLSWKDASIPYDTQSGFKLFKPTSDFLNVLSTPFSTRWLFDVEMLTRFSSQTGRAMVIWEEPLESWADVAGSKVSLRETLRIGGEILTVKSRARSSVNRSQVGNK